MAEHSAIQTIDHLSQLVPRLDKNATALAKIRLHCKCTGLIKNVLAPNFHKELIADVGTSAFSLITDESTDITMKKCLDMIKYFSESEQKIETTFYQMIEIQDGTAITITDAVKNALNEDKLPLLNLMGIGVDGTNSMVDVIIQWQNI